MAFLVANYSKAISQFRIAYYVSQTWRSAHASASGSQIVAPPSLGDRALAVPNLLGLPGNKSRFLSSMQPQDQFIANPLELATQDTMNIHEGSKRMLREHIQNDEMFNISTYLHKGEGCGLFLFISILALISKAINWHIFNDGALKAKHEKVISLFEVITVSQLLHDDLVDNTQVRDNRPAAHVVWNPYKVLAAGNMMLAITVNEAAKLGKDVTLNVTRLYERACCGAYKTYYSPMNGTRLAQYLTITNLKAGCPASLAYKSLAQVSGANHQLTGYMAKMGFNALMLTQVVDDIKDLEDDMREGVASAAVIYAIREHPILEELIDRRFQAQGDVETAMELVNNSSGKEKARRLASGYYQEAMECLHMLVSSPYRDAFENMMLIQYERKINR